MEPLDLMGKPWVNYHLELQLLQVTECRPVIIYEPHHPLVSEWVAHLLVSN